MIKFNLADTIQLRAVSPEQSLGAGHWHLDRQPVKHFTALNNLYNPVMQWMTFCSADNQSPKCLPIHAVFMLLCYQRLRKSHSWVNSLRLRHDKVVLLPWMGFELHVLPPAMNACHLFLNCPCGSIHRKCPFQSVISFSWSKSTLRPQIGY